MFKMMLNYFPIFDFFDLFIDLLIYLYIYKYVDIYILILGEI